MSHSEKPKPLINMTDTYQTRVGLPVRIFATDLIGENCVAAAIQLTDSTETLVRLNKYGEYYDGTEHDFDVFNVDHVFELFIVYFRQKDASVLKHYYESFESACTDISKLKAVEGITVVCTKKVKINVNENEFDFNIE